MREWASKRRPRSRTTFHYYYHFYDQRSAPPKRTAAGSCLVTAPLAMTLKPNRVVGIARAPWVGQNDRPGRFQRLKKTRFPYSHRVEARGRRKSEILHHPPKGWLNLGNLA